MSTSASPVTDGANLNVAHRGSMRMPTETVSVLTMLSPTTDGLVYRNVLLLRNTTTELENVFPSVTNLPDTSTRPDGRTMECAAKRVNPLATLSVVHQVKRRSATPVSVVSRDPRSKATIVSNLPVETATQRNEQWPVDSTVTVKSSSNPLQLHTVSRPTRTVNSARPRTPLAPSQAEKTNTNVWKLSQTFLHVVVASPSVKVKTVPKSQERDGWDVTLESVKSTLVSRAGNEVRMVHLVSRTRRGSV